MICWRELESLCEQRADLEAEVTRLQGIEQRVGEDEQVEEEMAAIENWFASAPPTLGRLATRMKDLLQDIDAQCRAGGAGYATG